MKQKLTQDRLKELLSYDPETGLFIWNIDRTNQIKKGMIAGGTDSYGCTQIKIEGVLFLAHKLVFLYMDNYWPKESVRHIDEDRKNNRYINLEKCSCQQITRYNKISTKNKSGIIGVSWNSRYKKWCSQIRASKHNIFLGYFDNLIDALKARWGAEVKYNFPNCNTTSSAYLYIKEHGGL